MAFTAVFLLAEKHQHGKICFSCLVERGCGKGRAFVILGISISLGCLHPFCICLSLNLGALVRFSEFCLFAASPPLLLMRSLDLAPSQNARKSSPEDSQKHLHFLMGTILHFFLCHCCWCMFTILFFNHLVIYIFV